MADLGLDASQETRITVMQMQIERLEEKQITPMQDNNLFGNAYAGTKPPKKKKKLKEGVPFKKFYDTAKKAISKKQDERKPEKAMDAGARAKRKLARREYQSKVSSFVPDELKD